MVDRLTFGGSILDVGDYQLDYMPIKKRNAIILPILKEFIIDTLISVPFYYEFYKEELETNNPVDFVQNISSIGDIALLPLLTPIKLRSLNSALEILPEKYQTEIKVGIISQDDPLKKIFSSSGSTGKPKLVYYTASDWNLSCLLFQRTVHDVDDKLRNKIYCTFNPGHIGGQYYASSASYAKAIFVPKHFTKVDALSVLDELLNAPQGPFNVLQIPPRPPRGTKISKGVTLYDLIIAEGQKGTNYLGENIRIIISNGGPLHYRDDDIDLIEIMHRKNEVAGVDFKTRIVDQGGSAETLYNFNSCSNYLDGKKDRGIHTLHLMQGMNYIEVINPLTGKHADHGQYGLLVVTSMKKGSRYIRYIIGDIVQYIDPNVEPCGCGRTTARIYNIHRDFEKIRLEGGCAVGGS